VRVVPGMLYMAYGFTPGDARVEWDESVDSRKHRGSSQ
jgi:hypothetical protein